MAGTTSLLVIFILILLIPILLGVPVAYSLGVSALTLMLLPIGPSLNLDIVSIRMLRSSTNFILLAIPFYLYTGRLLSVSGATDAIFEFTKELVGPIRGGIAHVNVLASMIFSGMSGSAIADAAGLGTVEYSMMEKAGYNEGFSVSLIGSSSIIGPIIPPSIPLIIYGVLAEVSIGALFLAGIIPGILMGISLMLLILYYSFNEGFPRGNNWNLTKLSKTFVHAVPGLFTIVLIIGGIFSGIFTATEAGAVAVLWVLLIGVVYYGEIDAKTFWETSRNSMTDVGGLLLILACAGIYAFVVTAARIPQLLIEVLIATQLGPTGMLLMIVVALLFLGMVMDPLTNLILVIPIIAPNFAVLGIDPLHAGIVIILTLMLGLLTPPVGAVLFVLEQITDVPLEKISRSIVPFYIPLLSVLLLLILFPTLVTYIPSL